MANKKNEEFAIDVLVLGKKEAKEKLEKEQQTHYIEKRSTKISPLKVRPRVGFIEVDEEVEDNEQKGYYFSYLTVIFIILDLLFVVFLLIKNTEFTEEVQVFTNAVRNSALFLGIGILLFIFAVFIFTKQRGLFKGLGWKNILVGILIGSLGSIVQFIFLSIFKFSLNKYDFLMFYMCMAISEEILFRGGIQTLIILGLSKIFVGRNKIIIRVMGIIVSALGFSSLHIFVYADVGFIYFIVIFIIGCLYGFSFEFMKDKRLDVPILAHFLNNTIYALTR